MRQNTYLIIGLGNPDKEYSETRHNVGFMFLDFLAEATGAGNFELEKKLLAETAAGKLNGQKILLAKPQTFVNKSGEAVKRLTKNYKLKTVNLIIVHDDLDVPFGSTKLSPGSGSGGHKGVQSIISQLKTENIARLKIGIANKQLKLARQYGRGSPGAARSQRSDQKRKEMVAKIVLSKFTPSEKEQLRKTFGDALTKLDQIVS